MTRVHHAIGDGVTLARVLLGASDEGDPGPGIGGAASHHSALGALLGGGVAALAHPRESVSRGYRDAGTLAKLLPPRPEHSRVLKGEGRPGHRVAWSDPIDLWRVKRVAQRLPRDGQRRAHGRARRRGAPTRRWPSTASPSGCTRWCR